ncbi:MAG: hypothetical protein JJT88_00125 [Gammaproteobacteria bacterium]|nr:hypothetical protein [Gammaproteobacteria bacterium]
MTLGAISVGFGRTGTMSLRMALNELGLGPCYHMEDVLQDMPRRVPQWNAALAGKPDWAAIFDGFHSAVDWPVAAYWRELADAYPDARIILSSRSAESWYQSISQTILAVLSDPSKWPEPQRKWLEMVHETVIERSLGGRSDKEGVMDAFNAHEAAVKATIPAARLLVHQAADGWAPLCAFLGVPIPDTPYPRSNSREEFFELLTQGGG